MIESSLIQALRDSVPGLGPSQAAERASTRDETTAIMDRVPSMWNFALLKAGEEGRDHFADKIQTDTILNVDNR